jgi:Glycosyltransferase family 25 (LPS biosynthesis protein)
MGEYHLLLISMETPTGARRRSALNWTPNGRIIGVSGDATPPEFAKRFRFLPAALPSTRNGIIGCCWSHMLALRKIIEEDLKAVIVLEDDAKLVNPLPPRGTLPNRPVYLGGALRTPGPWARERRDFPEALEASIWAGLRLGLNEVSGFSVVGAEALFVPDAAAAHALLELMEDPCVRLLHLDLFRRKHFQVPLLWFPNCFSAADDTSSQVEGRVLLRDHYATGVRKIARRASVWSGDPRATLVKIECCEDTEH